jgi:hypothetical protein
MAEIGRDARDDERNEEEIECVERPSKEARKKRSTSSRR